MKPEPARAAALAGSRAPGGGGGPGQDQGTFSQKLMLCGEFFCSLHYDLIHSIDGNVMMFCCTYLMSLLCIVLDEFPAPPGSAYPGSRPGQPGYEQDQRPGAGGTRPYGQDQRPVTDQRQGCFLHVLQW